MPHNAQQSDNNRPCSYSRWWTGPSRQWRLMWGNIIKKKINDICIWKDSLHWPHLQASSSPIPRIRKWPIDRVTFSSTFIIKAKVEKRVHLQTVSETLVSTLHPSLAHRLRTKKRIQKNDQVRIDNMSLIKATLPMCGFIAQLVEHRTRIAEVMGSNPVEALIFSGYFFPFA